MSLRMTDGSSETSQLHKQIVESPKQKPTEEELILIPEAEFHLLELQKRGRLARNCKADGDR